MPLEIKLHAVPHFKGLIKGKKISGSQERGSTFTKKKTYLKTPRFISYRAKWPDIKWP